MILQRYVLRELLASFAFTFAIVIAVFAVGVTFQTVRDSTGGLTDVLLRSAFIALAYATPYALLIASATSATLTYGRLAADNEIDAIRTSGIHLNRIVMPGLLFGLLLVAASFVINQEVLPRALFARRNLIRELAFAVLHNPPQGKQSFRLGDQVSLTYEDAGNGRIDKPVLTIFGKDGKPQLILQGLQARALIRPGKEPAIVLVDGQITHYGGKGQMTVGTFRGEHEQNLPIEPPLEYPEAVGDMTRDQIEKHISPGEKGFGHPGSVTEYWGRYGRSLAPLALTLIAVPVGLMVRKGSRLAGLGMALPALLGYIVLMMSFEGLGRRGRIAPEIAGLGPSALLMLLSTVMLVRVFRR